MTVGQNSSGGAPPARPPHVLAKMSFIMSMAMSQRMPSHWSAISARVSAVAPQRRQKAFSWTTSGQAGNRGRGRERARCRPPLPGGRVRDEVVLGPRTKSSGCSHPRVVGGDVIRHVVEDQPHAAGGQRGPRRASPSRPPNMSTRLAADAIGRADDVVGPQVRQGPRNDAWSSSFALATASPAGLRSHTPISHTASTPSGVTESQSAPPTSANVRRRPAPRDSSSSQTAVLIS